MAPALLSNRTSACRLARPTATSRRQPLRVTCFGSTTGGPATHRDDARRTSPPQSMASAAIGHIPSGTGAGLSSWMSMLDMFFLQKNSAAPAPTPAAWYELSDVNFTEDDDEDSNAAHMYGSHLATRLATESRDA
ncbi:hypothetical protein TSOC_003542 [Tetrabaena socialis]|uniref:Uncharacterized protein n=1 Tax=Tetrabaena socialis TaxID=47790 RepID=A0A2J8ABE4_9CHLO|nr:hypothetical protein TSOC_003542 [Tetrabaena socialis]|eukprot:PNH09826.1 hypothetical protein TSOC_003542 [Tetrabaena socialis]